VENRNSADYMEFEKTVKVRRRQIFLLNNLMRPENTPLFPTGELVFENRELRTQDAIGYIEYPNFENYTAGKQ
jgi:hypothetical protein